MCEERLIFRPFCGSILEVSYCNILISKFFLQLSQVVGMKVLERPLLKALPLLQLLQVCISVDLSAIGSGL
jgi:hypothetical protein